MTTILSWPTRLLPYQVGHWALEKNDVVYGVETILTIAVWVKEGKCAWHWLWSYFEGILVELKHKYVMNNYALAAERILTGHEMLFG